MQDCLGSNPAGVFDFWSDRSIGGNDCIQHQDHADFFQYFGSFPETEYDGETTRNRMFCDIRGTNIASQTMHIEGTNRWGTNAIPPTAGNDIVEPSTYEDWYLARWSIESQRTSITGNFSSHIMRNITFEDITCSKAGFTIRPERSAEGFKFRNLITHKWKSDLGDGRGPKSGADTINILVPQFFGDGFERPEYGSFVRNNSFENWWVVDQGNGGDQLGPGGGTINFMNPQPEPVEVNPHDCLEVTWVDADEIDLRTNNPFWNWLNSTAGED